MKEQYNKLAEKLGGCRANFLKMGMAQAKRSDYSMSATDLICAHTD
jgi:hypothetical protein